MSVKKASNAKTSNLLKKYAKDNFKGIELVKTSSSVYAGGSSLRVKYYGKEKNAKFESFVNSLQYGSFNSMEDIYESEKNYKPPTLNGYELNDYKFVFVDFVLSESENDKIMLKVCKDFVNSDKKEETHSFNTRAKAKEFMTKAIDFNIKGLYVSFNPLNLNEITLNKLSKDEKKTDLVKEATEKNEATKKAVKKLESGKKAELKKKEPIKETQKTDNKAKETVIKMLAGLVGQLRANGSKEYKKYHSKRNRIVVRVKNSNDIDVKTFFKPVFTAFSKSEQTTKDIKLCLDACNAFNKGTQGKKATGIKEVGFNELLMGL